LVIFSNNLPSLPLSTHKPGRRLKLLNGFNPSTSQSPSSKPPDSEGITGHLLVRLSKDDIGTIGVRSLRERLELDILVQDLKADWRITERDSLASDVYAGNSVGLFSQRPALMEDGKGAPRMDLPPYNA
jgi:hypothetical protein